MAPEMPYRKRRSRSQTGENDGSEGSTPSESVKRQRTNGHRFQSESESPAPENSQTTRGISSSVARPIKNADGDGFSPGSIVRVKLTNFITYDNAEFFPGPNLNMVIGPNGTGKSSLVCALCLGLGAMPKVLGRADSFGEFVKHGMSDAFVEIELQRLPDQRENDIIKLRIKKDGNNREWWLNGKKSSHKTIQDKAASYKIQIDNLCQFLPQDKVSEFSGLTPVKLLTETQRAVAPEEMLEWHEKLKDLKKEQKVNEKQLDTDKEQLKGLEIRQNNLRPEVEQLENRAKTQKNLDLLERSIPFVEYRRARIRHIECKEEMKAARKRLTELESQVEPTLRLIDDKKLLERQLGGIVQDRRKGIEIAEKAAADILRRIEQKDDQIKECDQRVAADREGIEISSRELAKMRRKILDLEARLREPAIEFDAREFNDRIAAKNHEMKVLSDKKSELNKEQGDLKKNGKELRDAEGQAKAEIAEFDSQAGKQVNKIAKYSKDTSHAWKWVQDNRDKFEKEVYGPPLITCSVKDQRYIDAIEAVFSGQSSVLTITAQTYKDYRTLTDHFTSSKMAEVRVQMSTQSLAQTIGASQPSTEQLNRLGLDGWAIDYIDAPEPVLAMLCNDIHAHRTALTLRNLNEEQHQRVVSSGITSFITTTTSYRISTRREYGPSATSTRTNRISPAKYFVDGVVDTSGKRELELKLEEILREFDRMKQHNSNINLEIRQLDADLQIKGAEITEIQLEKGVIQKAAGDQKAIPSRLKREKLALEQREAEIAKSHKAIGDALIEQDKTVLMKSRHVLEHVEKIKDIVIYYGELDIALTRRIEADSDFKALQDRNHGIVQSLDDERVLLKRVEEESNGAREAAKRALERCQQTNAEASPEDEQYFKNIPEDKTVQQLETEIAAERNTLELIGEHNPRALEEFNRRQVQIQKLEGKIGDTQEEIERSEQEISEIMATWEPRLDGFISKISDAFSENFEQIGCAGEVSVHKDEDFEEWAIEIKVKFRENETLQILDKHRQSGGERSVSTIFYLMSLQALAVAPFRVVDEINQGMDPRNERMVHGRMVEIACQRHTSQYFLITPKLLHDLKYDRRMKVLCIASGEFMPDDDKKFNVKAVIQRRRAMVAAA